MLYYIRRKAARLVVSEIRQGKFVFSWVPVYTKKSEFSNKNAP